MPKTRSRRDASEEDEDYKQADEEDSSNQESEDQREAADQRERHDYFPGRVDGQPHCRVEAHGAVGKPAAGAYLSKLHNPKVESSTLSGISPRTFLLKTVSGNPGLLAR